MTLAFSVIIGWAIGTGLDRYFKTTWCTMTFAVLGVIAGFREFIRAVNKANQAAEEEQRDEKSGDSDKD